MGGVPSEMEREFVHLGGCLGVQQGRNEMVLVVVFRFDAAEAEPWADRLRCCRLGLVWLTQMAMVLLVVTETLCLVPGGGMSRSGCVRSGRCPSIGETVFASVRSKCVGRSSFPCRRPREYGSLVGSLVTVSGRHSAALWPNPTPLLKPFHIVACLCRQRFLSLPSRPRGRQSQFDQKQTPTNRCHRSDFPYGKRSS